MPPVFGRNSDPHQYDNAIATWINSLEPEERAIGRNLMYDHRVNEERAKAFNKIVKGPPTSSALQKALKRYFEEKVRTRKLPHYVYTTINENNLHIANNPLNLTMSRDIMLVRALDLNGLSIVYQWAIQPKKRKKEWLNSFASFPQSPTDSEIDKWLCDKIGGGSKTQIEELVATVLDILNLYRLEQPFQPTWAAVWSEFEPYVKYGADRWLQLLGMVKSPPRWLILLGYTLREAGTVARPTMLDAGWYAYHFPSPPQALPEQGGHPMDLRILPSASYLLREYVHRQIHHSLKHWENTGSIIGRTTTPNQTPLEDQRKAHHELTARVYGADVYKWMSIPI